MARVRHLWMSTGWNTWTLITTINLGSTAHRRFKYCSATRTKYLQRRSTPSFRGQMGALPPQRTPRARWTWAPVIPLIASQHLPTKQIALVQSPFLSSNPSRMRVRACHSSFFSLFQTRAKQAGSTPAYIRACHMRRRLYMVVRQFLLIIPSDKI